ncbi:hypothetical protein HCMG_00926 [Helicobacter canadensis MIT 98-5491]|nr:hypothetical protein HCMG_00926 [Helicobacter canadensis MIT 98-5491]
MALCIPSLINNFNRENEADYIQITLYFRLNQGYNNLNSP